MTGILMLDSLTRGNTLKQGDKTPLTYKLLDADGDKLDVAGKTATVRLLYPNYLTIGYEKSGLTVQSDDTVTFTIDKIVPARKYHVEIIVDNKFVFPSRSVESKFTIDKSSLGTESNIIEIVGKEVLINAVKSKVDAELQPLVTSLQAAQQAEAQRVTVEASRVSAEAQRKTDHANRSAELAGKADKVVLNNMVKNGDFSDGLSNWSVATQISDTTKVVDGKLHMYGQNTVDIIWPTARQTSTSIVGHINYFRAEISEMASDSINVSLQDKNRTIISNMRNGVHSAVRTIDSGQTLTYLYLNHVMPTGAVVDYKVDNIMSIDLTATFGAGNEPTKEEMDNLIKVTGYIDGEYALNNKEMLSSLMKGIGEKANKKQEDWKSSSLLNGATGSISFSKNDMSFVTVRVNTVIDISTYNTILTTLPDGYKPITDVSTILRNYTIGTVNVQIHIDTNGHVRILSGATSGQGVRGMVTYYAGV